MPAIPESSLAHIITTASSQRSVRYRPHRQTPHIHTYVSLEVSTAPISPTCGQIWICSDSLTTPQGIFKGGKSQLQEALAVGSQLLNIESHNRYRKYWVGMSLLRIHKCAVWGNDEFTAHWEEVLAGVCCCYGAKGWHGTGFIRCSCRESMSS